VAAKDPTRSTTEQTSARSNRQEEQDYTNAMQDSILDTTTVTPNNNTSTFEKKRNRGNGGPKHCSWNQTKIGDIPLPITAFYPRNRECKSVTDTIMTTWVKAKYPLFTKEISIHCTADDNKRKALNLIAATNNGLLPKEQRMQICHGHDQDNMG
jgi:hypothetical protein